VWVIFIFWGEGVSLSDLKNESEIVFKFGLSPSLMGVTSAVSKYHSNNSLSICSLTFT